METRHNNCIEQIKERQLAQEKKFQQKKWEEAEIRRLFSKLAPELLFGIISYSTESDIKQLAYVSKSFNEMVLGYFNTTTFAV